MLCILQHWGTFGTASPLHEAKVAVPLLVPIAVIFPVVSTTPALHIDTSTPVLRGLRLCCLLS